MSITSFLALVQFRTKITSILPCLFGSLYALYAFDTFNLYHAVIMCFSVLLFDMTRSALSTYINYKNNLKKEELDAHNVMTRYQLNPKLVKYIIGIMFIVASLLGLYLTYLTHMTLFFLGILCFTIGILYSLAPSPIPHLPLGELLIGITLGLILTFMSIYIHAFDTDLLLLQIRQGQLLLRYNPHALMDIVIVCIPFMITISNIVLASNLCDIDEETSSKSYTLPSYIGKEKSLMLWEMSYYAVYIIILALILTKHLPWICLATLITFIPVKYHIDHFKLKQVKSETFGNVIQNYFFIGMSLILTLGLDVFVSRHLFK